MMKSWKVEDEESPDITFAGGISWKAWIWTPFRSKNMKRKCGKSNQLFYFQASEPQLDPLLFLRVWLSIGFDGLLFV